MAADLHAQTAAPAVWRAWYQQQKTPPQNRPYKLERLNCSVYRSPGAAIYLKIQLLAETAEEQGRIGSLARAGEATKIDQHE